MYHLSGFDFREYSRPSIQRLVMRRMEAEKLSRVSELLDRVMHDPDVLARLIDDLTIRVTEMFRDPPFFSLLRTRILPLLETHPHPRVWLAGCATGEEIYSIAILLQESGLIDRTRIYATDLNQSALDLAKTGRIPSTMFSAYEKNYRLAGGEAPLEDFFTRGDEELFLKKELLDRVVLSPHSLACDGPFNEFHLLLCRNVMIYFEPALQEKVHRLLYHSLAVGGILGLGNPETIARSPFAHAYRTIDESHRLYQRVS